MSPKHHGVIRVARLAALAAAVMTVAIVAAVALGAVQRRSTTMIPVQAKGSATAKCKHGQVALAGGFAVPGSVPSNGEGPVARFASMPAGKRGITTKAFNFGHTDAGKLDSFAYCGTRRHPPEIRSKSVSVPPNGYGTVVAKCQRGSQAIAGGFGTNKFSKAQGPEIITVTSKRTGRRGWKVGGFNIGESSPSRTGSLTAYAYCKAPGPKMVTRSKEATVGTGLRSLNMKCPDHAMARSGGFDGHFKIAHSQATAAAATTSKRAAHGRGWRTSALSVSSPSQATISTYVYCRR